MKIVRRMINYPSPFSLLDVCSNFFFFLGRVGTNRSRFWSFGYDRR